MSEIGNKGTKLEPYSPLFCVNPLNMQSVMEDSSQHLSAALFILSSASFSFAVGIGRVNNQHVTL